MILLAGFLEVLFRAAALVGLAVAVGGLAWILIALRPFGGLPGWSKVLAHRSLLVSAGGAAFVALMQASQLIVAPWALADELGRWPLGQFLATGFARAGLIHTGLALLLAGAILYLARHPTGRLSWGGALVAAGALVASGAWLAHAVSRLEGAESLMVATVLHQLAAAAWIGGTLHLTVAWRLLKPDRECSEIWPLLLARFSPMAMAAVALLLVAGMFLAQHYIGGTGGLFGTAYGTMLVTKVVLLCAALVLGGLNSLLVRRWRRRGGTTALTSLVPPFIETEMAIGLVVFLAAAALTSQPPAVDVQTERATPAEVLEVFAPKLPQLVPPSREAMLSRSRSVLDPFALPTEMDRWQSNFNHNLSGLLVFLAGCGALLHRSVRWSPSRHWPLIFVLLAGFIAVYGEPTVWPVGPEGFWASLMAPEVLQHRLATLLVSALGIFEWRVQAGSLSDTRWRFAFPLLSFAGGALLLTHTHGVFVSKWAFLIETSHAAIGVLAVLLGAGRWLELRLPPPANRFPGRVWPVCLILIGLVLLFYRE
jgi:putative copper resistance protein D